MKGIGVENKKIILISGKAGHGKTTSAQMIKAYYDEKTVRKSVIFNYADLLKFYCTQYFGWDGNKDESGRRLLQHVGTDLVRKSDNNYWVNAFKAFIKCFGGEFDTIIVGDCRFKNELLSDPMATAFLSAYGYGTTHIRISRPGYDNGLTPEQKQHLSEIDLDDVKPDFLIVNNGDLRSLYDKVVGVIKNIV